MPPLYQEMGRPVLLQLTSEKPWGLTSVRTLVDCFKTLLLCGQDNVVPALKQSHGACSCGGAGWTRVAYLDMTDTDQQCPLNWTLITSPKRSCGRSTGTHDWPHRWLLLWLSYIPLVLKVSGTARCVVRLLHIRLHGHPEAFVAETLGYPMTIDGPYVNGVSVTRGNPRQHIWTSMSEVRYRASICPCTNTNSFTIPSYVGEDYFCDTGVPPGQDDSYEVFYSADPLWDGDGCGSISTCCTFNDPPLFCKQLPQTTTDDIEVRICSTQGLIAENVPIESIEFYVK